MTQRHLNNIEKKVLKKPRRTLEEKNVHIAMNYFLLQNFILYLEK